MKPAVCELEPRLVAAAGVTLGLAAVVTPGVAGMPATVSEHLIVIEPHAAAHGHAQGADVVLTDVLQDGQKLLLVQTPGQQALFPESVFSEVDFLGDGRHQVLNLSSVPVLDLTAFLS